VPIDRATIVHVADLARIALTDEEIERFTGQLSVVLDAVERLKTVDTSEIPPTASTLPLVNVQRDDVVRPGLTTDEALRNAPKGGRDGEFFRVQEILEGR
jgi:aspartyl-tRNA(Asn)/glutamyl-tRNA(Gln) amidotransferase subunit C